MKEMNDEKIFVLRHAYRISKVIFQPYPNPETGMLPDHIKVPDSNGDIHLTKKEEDEKNLGKIFLKSTINIEIEDGRPFNLNNPMDLAIWDAIKHNPEIVDSRTARDANGNLIIDGGNELHNGALRYGRANIWVERANAVTNTSVNKEELVIDAKSLIKKDSAEGLILKTKLLGRYTNTMAINDLKEYLYGIAGKNPQQIIDLYEGTDTNIRLMLIEAQEKGVIEVRDHIYYFGRNTILGANTDTVIAFLKAPSNHKILETIRQTVHPTSKEFKEDRPVFSQPQITQSPDYTAPVNTYPVNTDDDEDKNEGENSYSDIIVPENNKVALAAKMRAAKEAKKAQRFVEERGYTSTGEDIE